MKRAVVVWHRRSGKDKTAINFMAKKMFERVGQYFYFLPTYKQGRKIIWDGIDGSGFRLLDHIHPDLRVKTNDQEMKIQLVNGSIFQVIGTDNVDSIVGTNPVGCVFSEYSLQDPQAWDFIRPILAENGGWALFLFTPRGKNHAYTLYKMALKSPEWFAQKLTVEDTGAIPGEVLKRELEEIIQKNGDDALYMQEYMCSFEVPIQGSFYGVQLSNLSKNGQIGKIPIEPSLPVHTAWDLGVGDSTAIWFFQVVGREIRIIDYYENSGEGLAHYAKILKEKEYLYGVHLAPHDIRVKELGTGKTRIETARQLGINFAVVPKHTIEDGIEAVRNLLPRCWFDEERTEKGLSALRSYHKEWDDKNQVYKSHPAHDWSSHAADAFRYLAIGVDYEFGFKPTKQTAVEMPVEVDPYE